MLKTESRAIGNSVFHVRQLGTRVGRATLTRLLKTLGPAMGAFLEGRDLAKIEGEPSGSAMAKVLAELSGSLSDEDLDYFCRTFGEATLVETEAGRQVPLTLETQELLFAGKYDELFKWLLFCLEVNYSSFLAGFGPGNSLAPSQTAKAT